MLSPVMVSGATQTTELAERSQPFLVGFDPLKPLTQDERTSRLDRYLTFLTERDGEPNVGKRTLSRREAWINEITATPVNYKGKIDHSLLDRYLRERPGPDVDPKVLWVLATAKANRVEHYGVTLDFSLHGDQVAQRYGQHMAYIDLEEFYHTRILRESVRVFDFDLDLEPPKTFTRFFAEVVVRSPHWFRLVTALCGELFGSVAFLMLWEKISLFDDDPEAAARLRMLMREILIDEMGHAAYGHAMLGKLGIRTVRSIAPMVSAYFLADLPEFSYLAGGRRAFLDRVAAFDLGSNKALWG
jgi:hypothetical protein